MGVEGGREDDVPADGEGGALHLAPQHRVANNAGGLPHLLQHLVQTLDAAHNRALLHVRQLGDLRKGLGGGGAGRRRGNGKWGEEEEKEEEEREQGKGTE